jgi:DNA-binding transcriptional MerR regulator
MFRIGDFAKISGVSVRTLLYYEETGLLKPQRIEPVNGYRYYSVEQIFRLNRILAYKDLGFSLKQIASFLNQDLSAIEIKEMLDQKQSEMHKRIEEEQARLARLQARLRQIEQEGKIPDEIYDYTPATLWALIATLRQKSDFENIIKLLEKYIDNLTDTEQEFLARHYLVDNYCLLGQHQQAVEKHKEMITRLRGKLPAAKLLWSLSDTTILRAWRQSNMLTEWREITSKLYAEIEDTADSYQERAIYLRTLVESVYMPAGEFEQARQLCNQIIELTNKYKERWPAAQFFVADVYGFLVTIYGATDNPEMLRQTITEAKQAVEGHEQKVVELQRKENDQANQYRRFHQYALHNLGCQCLWQGPDYAQNALEFLQKALLIEGVPETHFFLSGAILINNGDRQRSFEHFRQAVENPNFSRRHELKQAFLAEYFFEEVWGDNQFVSVIEKEVQNQVWQAQAN